MVCLSEAAYYQLLSIYLRRSLNPPDNVIVAAAVVVSGCEDQSGLQL